MRMKIHALSGALALFGLASTEIGSLDDMKSAEVIAAAYAECAMKNNPQGWWPSGKIWEEASGKKLCTYTYTSAKNDEAHVIVTAIGHERNPSVTQRTYTVNKAALAENGNLPCLAGIAFFNTPARKPAPHPDMKKLEACVRNAAVGEKLLAHNGP